MKKSIARQFFFNTFLTAIVLIIIFTIWEILQLHQNYDEEKMTLRTNYLEEQKSFIREKVIAAVDQIKLEKQLIENYRLTDIKPLSELQNDILERIGKIRFGDDGYFFIVSYDGVTLMNDTQRYLIGLDIWDMTDPNGVKVIQEERRAVENPEGDFIYYTWEKPTDGKLTPKVSFLKGVPDWQWMVGTGVYLDSLEQELSLLYEKLSEKIRNRIITFGLLIILLFVIFFVFSKSISRQIRDNIDVIKNAFEEKNVFPQKIETEKLKFPELTLLAQEANEMFYKNFTSKSDLEKREAELRAIIDTNPHLIYIKDKKGIYIRANKAVSQFFGIKLEKIKGKTDQDLMHSRRESDHSRRDDVKILKGKSEKIICEEILTDYKGEQHSMLTIKIPFKSSEESDVTILGTSIDVSELKKTEQKLEQQMNRLQSEINSRIEVEENLKYAQQQINNIVENSSNVFYSHTSQHQLTYISPQIETVLGYSPREALVKWQTLTTDNPINKKGEELTSKAIKSGKSQPPYELELKHKNGSKVWVEVRENPITFEDSVIIVGTLIDITDKKKLRETEKKYKEELEKKVEARTRELREQTEMYLSTQKALVNLVEDTNYLKQKLEETNARVTYAYKELESFSHTVSHDLRAPLRTIEGYGKLLEEEFKNILNEDAREYITAMRNGAMSMDRLLKDLLAFSKVGRQNVRKIQVSMHELFLESYNQLAPFYQENLIEFNLPELPTVKGDRSMIQQVVTNLLSNALKYSSKQKKILIDIGFEEMEDRFIFSVQDNGVGFDMNYVEKIFRVFERLHRDEEFPGTGIGLAIVKRIIDKHEGEVWVEAAENKGACFYFSLPRETEAAESEMNEEEIDAMTQRILSSEDYL